jgi:hypothetical protein
MTFETIIAKRFLALYGPPQTDDPETFFAEWKSRFDGCDAEILTAAVKLTIDRHKYPTWPTIGEFWEILEEVSEKIASRRSWDRAKALSPPVERERTLEERERATAMLAEAIRVLRAVDLAPVNPERPVRPRGGYAVSNDRVAWEARYRRVDAGPGSRQDERSRRSGKSSEDAVESRRDPDLLVQVS